MPILYHFTSNTSLINIKNEGIVPNNLQGVKGVCFGTKEWLKNHGRHFASIDSARLLELYPDKVWMNPQHYGPNMIINDPDHFEITSQWGQFLLQQTIIYRL